MAQYDRLWPAQFHGGLPVLFLFVNNFYAMGGQTIGETAGARLMRQPSTQNPHRPLQGADAREPALQRSARGRDEI